jgi:hypothetical protein
LSVKYYILLRHCDSSIIGLEEMRNWRGQPHTANGSALFAIVSPKPKEGASEGALLPALLRLSEVRRGV